MTKKREYTREIHIKRLAAILNSNKTLCNCCPAAKYYNGNHNSVDLWTNNACLICADFVGYHPRHTVDCPCIRFGDQEAHNITLLKMEAEGYTVI
jgi:hypothetical protein